MYKKLRILAIIPARGGSVGVLKKNLRSIMGRPLITHTIEHAQAVPEFDRIVVSTDSADIKEVSLESGVIVIDRPTNMAGPDAPTESAMIHALDTLAMQGEEEFDYVALLEPTSPLRRPETVRKCIRYLIEQGASSLLTVKETRESLGRIGTDGYFHLLESSQARRRQDRPPLYAECGVLYLVRVGHLRKTNSVKADNWLPYVVEDEEGVDINCEKDLMFAESLLGIGGRNP